MATKPKRAPKRGKNRPSFFKIMIGEFKDTIRIPLAFLRHYEPSLDTKITLKSPTGSCKYVRVKKIETGFFLQDGWPRFVRNNNIGFGDVLVFTLVGDSRFTVKIYDPTGCEKDMTNLHEKYQEKDSSGSVVAEKQMDGINTNTSSRDENQYVNPIKIKKGVRAKRSNSSMQDLLSSRKSNGRLTKNLQTEVISKEKEPASSGTEVILVDSDSESEDIGNSLNASAPSDEDMETQELVRPGVNRKPSQGRTSAKRKHDAISQHTERALRASDEFKTENVFYRAVLRLTYVTKGFMHLPRWFGLSVRNICNMKAGKNTTELIVRLCVSDKAWPVRLICLKHKAYICSGWGSFVAENNLVVGDVCILELIGTEDGADLKVSIFQCSEDIEALANGNGAE